MLLPLPASTSCAYCRDKSERIFKYCVARSSVESCFAVWFLLLASQPPRTAAAAHAHPEGKTKTHFAESKPCIEQDETAIFPSLTASSQSTASAFLRHCATATKATTGNPKPS